MALFLLLLALGLLAVAIWMVRLARQERTGSGLPSGRVVYVDSRNWRRPPEPLRAPEYGLVGRPDFIMQEGRTVIPVEAKPGRRAEEPYEGDVLQLAAYCLLVEESYGAPPPYGLLVYQEHTFEIPFDRRLRRRLLQLLDEMADARELDDVPRSHDQPSRCAACGMRGECGDEL